MGHPVSPFTAVLLEAMMALSLKCISLGLSVLPAFAGNAALRGWSIPSWCNDIPSADQQYVAECGGTAGGNGQSATGGGTPSWCENIPAASRADIPFCANQENASLSAAFKPATALCSDFCWIHQ